MSSRNERVRAQARARLELQTPVADDANLAPLQEEVDAIVREAKRRDSSGTDKPVSSVIDEIARAYFRHSLRRR